jgi:hypothetical protein
MDTGADCRMHAAQFLVQPSVRLNARHLINMAESWFRLTIKAEQIQALTDRARPIIPRNPNMETEAPLQA